MRPTRDQWAMSLVNATALRSTCCRRNVGCVMLNARGHVVSTGYNGVAAGLPHCNEEGLMAVHRLDSRIYLGGRGFYYWVKTGEPLQPPPKDCSESECVGVEIFHPNACSGATSPSGTNLDGCEAIHAEQNALLQCKNVYEIDTVYVSASPCVTCVKLLMNTSAKRVVFSEEYPHNQAKDMWEKSGRIWEKFDERN